MSIYKLDMYFRLELNVQQNVRCIKVEKDNVDAASQASEIRKRPGTPSSAEELEDNNSKIQKTHEKTNVSADGQHGSTPPKAPDSVTPTESNTPARFLVGGMTHRQAWVLILLPRFFWL